MIEHVPFSTHFNSLSDDCVSFYQKNVDKLSNGYILENRRQISEHIVKFHRDANTLTPDVKAKLEDFGRDSTIVLMTGHQPNLFPYSGVMRKATLIYKLKNEMENRTGRPVICYFGIADQDFSDDRWVRSSLLPDISRKDGILSLTADVPGKKTIFNVPKPSRDQIAKWKREIDKWMETSFALIQSHMDCGKFIEGATGNLEEFWKIVLNVHTNAQNYADFNAFILSNIINLVWGYDILFSRFSDSQRLFENEFNYLLSNHKTYRSSLKEAIQEIPEHRRFEGVNIREWAFLPFWVNCECGSKARLTPSSMNGSLRASGECVLCGKTQQYDLGTTLMPDLSTIISEVSARAISMILVFSKGLGLSGYIGGLGGIEYFKEAEQVARKLSILVPPSAVWRPRDTYLGLGQISAYSECKRIADFYNEGRLVNLEGKIKETIDNIDREIEEISERKKEVIQKFRAGEYCKEEFNRKLYDAINEVSEVKQNNDFSVLNRDLKILHNVPKTLDLIPNIIDYAVSISLIETSDQWIDFLSTDGSFVKDVNLKSIFEIQGELGKFIEQYRGGSQIN